MISHIKVIIWDQRVGSSLSPLMNLSDQSIHITSIAMNYHVS